MIAGLCRRQNEAVFLIVFLLALPGWVAAQSSHDCNDVFSNGILTNCGFEDPTPFNGWLVTNPPSPPLPWAIMLAGPPPTDPRFFSITPTEGMVAACHGFDGGVGTFWVVQDLTVMGKGVSVVEFDYRAACDLMGATFRPDGCHVHIKKVPKKVPGTDLRIYVISRKREKVPGTDLRIYVISSIGAISASKIDLVVTRTDWWCTAWAGLLPNGWVAPFLAPFPSTCGLSVNY